MIIRDILSMKGGAIFSMAPDGKVSAAVGMMVKNDIGSLVVIDGGRMTGMVTFREVLKALDAHGGNLADLRLAGRHGHRSDQRQSRRHARPSA